VVAGYTYLNPTAIGLAGAGIHGPIQNTAHNQANLWANYDFGFGLQLGTGVNYISERLAGTDAQLVPGTISTPTVPGYTTWDGMIGYRVNSMVCVQLNGFNLTDKYYFINSYFTRPNENHTVPGPGRTFLLTAKLSL
jgi:outer membrane receptor for monomeric catechols